MKLFRHLHSRGLNLLARAVYLAKGTLRCRRELERADHLPPDELEALVMTKLRRLLSHAFQNVPYYRAIARERGLTSDAFDHYEDLVQLPILTKEQIQTNRQALTAERGPSRDIRENHTSGSTAQPLKFLQDRQYREYNTADKARFYEMCHYRLGEPCVFLWGSDLEAAAHKAWWARLLDRMGYNLIWVNTYNLSEELLAGYAAQVAKHDPVLIVGYASSLTMYARYLQASDASRPHPKGIQCSAEVLTEPERDLLTKTLDCPVFDRYGCREVGMIAHECKAHSGLHTSPLNNLTEVVGPDGEPVQPGTIGRMVATNLNNYAMPFIRYEVGDLATATTQPCSCGRRTRRLSNVAGRVFDIIVSPTGKLVHAGFFTHLFFGFDGIKQFQVVQETRERLVVRMVPGAGADLAAVQAYLTDAIQEHGDPAFQVEFDICDRIETSGSGKYRPVIPKVADELTVPPSNGQNSGIAMQ